MQEAMTPEGMEDRLVDFAVRVGRVAEALPRTYLGRHVARQLVRSATSAAPNYAEGCVAESPRDFVHKLSLSLKELRETKVWLRIITKSRLLAASRLASVEDEVDQLCAILASSIKTVRQKAERRNDQ